MKCELENHAPAHPLIGSREYIGGGIAYLRGKGREACSHQDGPERERWLAGWTAWEDYCDNKEYFGGKND